MRILIFAFIVFCVSCKQSKVPETMIFADNVVVAHRGAWKANDLPENSIAALKHAISLGCTGTEFDVRMTEDSILIVTHDKDYNGLLVEAHTYKTLSQKPLENGEKLPTLEMVLKAGMTNNTTTGLVCEIKPASTQERGELMAEKALALVEKLDCEKFIHSYISFDYNILKKIISINPNAKTQYLNGEKSPKELSGDGISGLDYYIDKFKKNPHWIKEAKDLGLTLNVWTANKSEDLDLFVDNRFDYITTNEPEYLFERVKESPVAEGYELVWSDEFNYTGKPDSSKWAFADGFIANREEQYYTDDLKNALVEKGQLVITARKEKIKNKAYKTDVFKNKSWMKYATEIDSAKFTSARLHTNGLASWKYGKIEVRAKLPQGRGIWPAIWMLGDNRKEVGWPECGEIDIMEYVGFEPDSIYGTIHTKAYNHMTKTEKGKAIFIDAPYEGFHTYALDWTADKIDFLVDGKVFNRIENENKTTAEWPFDQDFYLILNVAVGGMWGGLNGVDSDIFPQQMLVDYVRVFQPIENHSFSAN